MLARVKQDYLSGSVTAFSGYEYIRSEWREVPIGFEEQAKNHPLLEIQPSLKEIRAGSSSKPGLGKPEAEAEGPAVTAVTAEPPAEPTTEDANPEPTAEEEPFEVEPSAEGPAEETPAEETEPRPARRRRRAAED